MYVSVTSVFLVPCILCEEPAVSLSTGYCGIVHVGSRFHLPVYWATIPEIQTCPCVFNLYGDASPCSLLISEANCLDLETERKHRHSNKGPRLYDTGIQSITYNIKRWMILLDHAWRLQCSTRLTALLYVLLSSRSTSPSSSSSSAW